ncbi:protein RETICULATA-RELATED 4, chloroplastic-like [Triticum dicoccoides]|uniref:protein RETICULATA-RELATED 4, chloroplastic-like n=1 Tax=Triticum dicoccoides TaxID=85692 RepID=UPI00188F5E08|nr:protein RETICULATA-RELATED 4, chloroplastic-like [Triticum dicoccoides]
MMKQGTAAASGAFTGGGDVRAGAGERKISSLPAYLATAVEGCHITGDIVRRFAEMELSPLLRWLLGFRGSRERLLTDDLFIAKLAMEMGVSMIAKTVAEYEKRRENFVKEIDIIIADVGGVVIQGMDFSFRLWSCFSQGDGDSKGGAQDVADGFNNAFGNDEVELDDGLEKKVCQRYAC